jgi:hypothetical protein
VVTCRADAAALCASCDADIHSANPLARRHERLHVAPFFGALADAPKPFASAASPKATDDDGSNEDEAASWLLPEPDHGQKEGATTEVFFADSDPYLDLDFARSMDDIKTIGFQQSRPPELDLAGTKLFYSAGWQDALREEVERGLSLARATKWVVLFGPARHGRVYTVSCS